MNAHALAICQARHDARLPDDEPDFLDTADGANWLTGAGETLIDGRDLVIGSLTAVPVYELHDAVRDAALQRITDGLDDENWLGQLLVAVANYDMPLASGCLRSLMGGKLKINGIAEDLCRQYADQAAEQFRRDADEDLAEMRFSA